MNLGQKLVSKLNAMRETENPSQFPLKPDGEAGGFVVTQEEDNIDLRVELDDFDKFSFMVKTISVARPQTPPSMPLKDVLLRQAGEIVKRITYLLESFRLIEFDEVNGFAQVRSITPYKKGEERLYYEVLLRGGKSLTFTRYRKPLQAGEREIVPSHLTQETFERLVDDLAAALRLS